MAYNAFSLATLFFGTVAMNKSNTLILSAICVILTACSSSHSTIRDEGVGYVISRTQAKEIVSSSILAHFSPDYVNPGPENSLTSSGYIRILIDTHTINATALPVKGVLKSGEAAEGFGFEVNAHGTIPISGGAKAEAVYHLLKQQASGVGEVISTNKQ